jgi:hypothetical protein
MWKNSVQQDRPQTTIRCVRTACWIPNQSEYVILIAFHSNSACTNAPQCFITCTMSALFILIFFLISCLDCPSAPRPPHYRGFKITVRHTTLGRTPLGVWSVPRRLLHSTTYNTLQHTSMPTAGFELASPTGAAADPRGHWNRLSLLNTVFPGL